MLTLTPLFYTQSELTLDAVKFNIKKLIVNGKESHQYSYDSNELIIRLAQPMTRREKITVQIDYEAKPQPDFNDEGAAISK